ATSSRSTRGGRASTASSPARRSGSRGSSRRAGEAMPELPIDEAARGAIGRHPAIGVGLFVELFALSLIPLVVLRRKEPSSTAAWILALVFLPVVGSILFLMFGRDRVRLPVRWKREADEALARRAHHRHHARLSSALREAALA